MISYYFVLRAARNSPWKISQKFNFLNLRLEVFFWKEIWSWVNFFKVFYLGVKKDQPIGIRGCSQILSAKNGGVQTPPPPLAAKNLKLAYSPPSFVRKILKWAKPPFPPCQKSYFVALQVIKKNPPFEKKFTILK